MQVYSHRDETGKRVYRSFTAPTKKQAEQAAAIWSAHHQDYNTGGITVMEAVNRYIDAKRGVLSPSTIRGYMSMTVDDFDAIGSVKLDMLKSADLQIWISDLAKTRKPKTVRNIYGLLLASAKMFAPDMTFNVTLPSIQRRQYRLPTDDDIQRLLDHAYGTRLWIALMLARYYSMRRSEICALESRDLDGDILTISRAMVMDENKQWVIKQPKTASSYRTLQIADPLLSEMKKIKGRYIDCNPDALIHRFQRALKTAKVEPFNFHLLRHMFASSAALLGVPDFYTASFGGWRPGSSVLKQIYQNVTDQDRERIMGQLNANMQDATRHATRKKEPPVFTEGSDMGAAGLEPAGVKPQKLNNYGNPRNIRDSECTEYCDFYKILYDL